MAPVFWAAGLGLVLVAAAPAMADEAPKYGGMLTFMIPADAPPSFDAHREGTFATVHSAAPFYSVLIRVDPNNPSTTTDFVCDLCAAVPQPTDSGRSALTAGTALHGPSRHCRRIKEPARMCRKPIFSSSAAKIPLFDLKRVKGMGQSRRTTLRRLFSAQAR